MTTGNPRRGGGEKVSAMRSAPSARARIAIFTAVFCFMAPLASADENTELLNKALRGFSAEPPKGWSYTVTSEGNDRTTVERYDPAKPAGQQWTLVSRNGKAPTADESAQYRRHQATLAPAGMKATFSRGDIDSANAQLMRETDTELEYLCRFRPDLADAMLSRLALTLVVNKETASIASFHFRLLQPFAPAFGVRMIELDVRMTFLPPQGDRPALPLTASSRFKGRILLVKSIEENLDATYSEFAPPPPRP